MGLSGSNQYRLKLNIGGFGIVFFPRQNKLKGQFKRRSSSVFPRLHEFVFELDPLDLIIAPSESK